MSGHRYSPEFKAEAVAQVVKRGIRSRRLPSVWGVSTWSLYDWLRAARAGDSESDELPRSRLEIQRLQAENRRLKEERGI
jgi:transposase